MPKERRFTQEETKLLQQLYSITKNSEILKYIPDKSVNAINQKAFKMGLKKHYLAKENCDKFDGSILENLTENEKHYLGGIIDGEGSIGMYKSSHQTACRFIVTVTNTDIRLIKWITDRIPDFGKPHAKEYKEERWRTKYSWVLSGNRKVMKFCEEIAPYLILKKEQAYLVTGGYVHLENGERQILIDKLKSLKRI